MTETIRQAIATSKRMLELHERGPIGRLDVHRALQLVGIDVCPICAEERA